jgi:hypothetical protein
MRQGLVRIGVVLGAALLLITGAWLAPGRMRSIDAFAVEHVELSGTRYLSPEAAVAAAGITATSSIFDDPAPWIEALSRHPLVRSVGIQRQLPGTLRITIEESRPVAFARTPELRPIDAAGRLLPADPGAEGMDLPVLAVITRVSAGGWAEDEETQRIAAFLGIAWSLEPGLLGWISEVAVHGDAVRLVLRNASDAEVLVPAAPTAARLRELHLTLADLAAPRLADGEADASGQPTVRDAGPDLGRVRRIDGRFHDQIVVALHRGKN